MKLNIWTVLLLVVILNLILQIHGDVSYQKELLERTENLKIKLEKEIARQECLKEQLSRLAEDIYVERIARSKLNLVKKGETAYKICQ